MGRERDTIVRMPLCGVIWIEVKERIKILYLNLTGILLRVPYLKIISFFYVRRYVANYIL